MYLIGTRDRDAAGASEWSRTEQEEAIRCSLHLLHLLLSVHLLLFFFLLKKLILSAAWSLSLFRRCHLQSQRSHSRSLAVQQDQLPVKANSMFVGREPWPEHPSQHDQKGRPLWNQRNFQRSPSCPYGLGCTAWQRDFCVVEGRLLCSLSLLLCQGLSLAPSQLPHRQEDQPTIRQSGRWGVGSVTVPCRFALHSLMSPDMAGSSGQVSQPPPASSQWG